MPLHFPKMKVSAEPAILVHPGKPARQTGGKQDLGLSPEVRG